MNSYNLSRIWFNWCFENPEKVKPIHTAIYFFAIEHCNRLGWKDKFGFPSQMAMEAIGVKNWRTYSKALYDLVDFGFIIMVEKSKNQYSSNIISLQSAYVKNTKAHTKALDKALQKHSTKQGRSTVSINKQETIEQVTDVKSLESDFISLWNRLRSGILNKPSHLNKLNMEQLENIGAYSFEELEQALKGLFKQEHFPRGQDYTVNPKHFCDYIETYKQAYHDKNKNVWGKKE